MLYKYNIFLVTLVKLLETVLATSSCTNTCAKGQIIDIRTCQCVPDFDCNDLNLSDPISCAQTNCADIESQLACPFKCLCSTPSPLTNYCEPCFNHGLLDKQTCKCTCPYPFQGPQCEYAPEPCAIEDDPTYCSRVDCYNATQADFFYCQRKCLCCKNKQCDNLGAVNQDCTCSCIPNSLDLYDASHNCALIATKCANDQQCFTTLGLKMNAVPRTPTDCTEMQRALCPLACKLCTPPLAPSGSSSIRR